MAIYIAEINGRAIAAFDADDTVAAEAMINSEAIKSDLSVFESDGKQLWNGKDELFVRVALEEEQEKYHAQKMIAIREGEIESDDEDWFVFLVPVIDPTDDDEEEPT